MSIVVRGLEETKQALYAIEIKLNVLKTKALDRFAQKVRDVAKENCERDTGALRESIYNNLLKASMEEIIEEVIAGSDNVIRGEGRFKMSRRTGYTVSSKPTSEYAEVHEVEKKFMEQAYNWADKNIDREIAKLISQVTRDF